MEFEMKQWWTQSRVRQARARIPITATGVAITLIASMAALVLPSTSAPALASDGPPALTHGINIPNGGQPVNTGAKAGYLPGSSTVSPTGAFAYSIPLDVPAGRNGMQPSLSLVYSSAAHDGPLGLGWSLAGMPTPITRCGKTLRKDGETTGVEYDESDRYCLDGQELIGVNLDASHAYGGNATEYRTEDDEFARIISTIARPDDGAPPATAEIGPDTFVAFTKDGHIRTYQFRNATRTADRVKLTDESDVAQTHLSSHNTQPVSDPSPTFPRVAWELASDEDRSGNAIRYEYMVALGAGGTERLVSKITYTSGLHKSAAREVRLIWEDRPDKSFSYINGVQFGRKSRLKAMEMWAPDPDQTKRVRTYNLSYLPVGPNDRAHSMLAQVQECGSLGGCLPAKIFTWAVSALPAFTTTKIADFPTEPKAARSKDDLEMLVPSAIVADFDGDGTDDLIYNASGTVQAPEIRFGTREAFTGAASPLAKLHGANLHMYPNIGLPTYLSDYTVTDMESDGKADLVARYGDPNDVYGPRRKAKILRWDSDAGKIVDTGITTPDKTLWEMYGDADGDGLQDRFYSAFAKPPGYDGPIDEAWSDAYTQRNLGNNTFDAPVDLGGPAFCGHALRDLNGDGRADLLLDASGANGGMALLPRLHNLPPLPLIDVKYCGHGSGAATYYGQAAPNGYHLNVFGNWAYGGAFGDPYVGPESYGFVGPVSYHVVDPDNDLQTDNSYTEPDYGNIYNALGDSRMLTGDFNGDGLADNLRSARTPPPPR